MTQRLACAECGIRYKPTADFRPGAFCIRDGCRGRIGTPVHITEQVERAIALLRLRATSAELQAAASQRDGRTHVEFYKRGAAAAWRMAASELEDSLTLDPQSRQLDWPDEPTK